MKNYFLKMVLSVTLVLGMVGCDTSGGGSTSNLADDGAYPYEWGETLYGYEIQFKVESATGGAIKPGFIVIYKFDYYDSVVGYNTKNQPSYYPDSYTYIRHDNDYKIDIHVSYYNGGASEDYTLTPTSATTGTYTYHGKKASGTGTAEGTYRILVKGGSGGGTSGITIKITDTCDDGLPIYYKFYDKTNNLVWYSSSYYKTNEYGYEKVSYLTCSTGATICFGGESGDRNWGVHLDGKSAECESCCIRCEEDIVQSWGPECD